MSDHGREHEDWLARVLAGEVDPGSPESRERLAACPDCRRELARLGPLAADLRELAGRERSDLARAREQADRGDADLVRLSLERASAAEGRRRWRSVVVAAVAAAAMLLLGWLWRASVMHAPDREIILSGGRVACLAPVGAPEEGREAFEEFRWRYDLPSGWTYRLIVSVGERRKKGPEIWRRLVDEPRWTPSFEERASLPDEIYWEVEVVDALDEVRDHGFAVAWRP